MTLGQASGQEPPSPSCHVDNLPPWLQIGTTSPTNRSWFQIWSILQVCRTSVMSGLVLLHCFQGSKKWLLSSFRATIAQNSGNNGEMLFVEGKNLNPYKVQARMQDSPQQIPRSSPVLLRSPRFKTPADSRKQPTFLWFPHLKYLTFSNIYTGKGQTMPNHTNLWHPHHLPTTSLQNNLSKVTIPSSQTQFVASGSEKLSIVTTGTQSQSTRNLMEHTVWNRHFSQTLRKSVKNRWQIASKVEFTPDVFFLNVDCTSLSWKKIETVENRLKKWDVSCAKPMITCIVRCLLRVSFS